MSELTEPSPHPSALVLDELAAGFAPPPEAAAHVATCAACTEAVAQRTRAAERLLASPESQRRLERLTRTLERPAKVTRSSPLRQVIAIAVPLAACVAMVIFVPRAEHDTLKGTSTVSVLDTQGTALQRASPSQRVTLAVGGAGRSQAAVLTVSASGRVDVLWPPGGASSAALGPGASVPLADFAVTPGSLALHAFFADTPLDTAALSAELRSAVERSGNPLEAHLTSTAKRGYAWHVLEVAP